jgi:hypothetical protein
MYPALRRRGGGGGNPDLYQRVTVLIPTTDTTTERALTVGQARSAIDFYEVTFKDSDGRIFSASATRDKTLTIRLPAEKTYETVLLAGTYSGILLASAYRDSITVTANTKTIEYDLLALDSSVNTVKFANDVSVSRSQTTGNLPYFDLTWDRMSSQHFVVGTITIGNFPDAAIFDPVLVANNSGEFYKCLLSDSMEGMFICIFIVDGRKNIEIYDTAYNEFKKHSKDAADIAAGMDGKEGEELRTAVAAYVAAANILIGSYEKLRAAVTTIQRGELWEMMGEARSGYGDRGGIEDIADKIDPAAYSAWQAALDAFPAYANYTSNEDHWAAFLKEVVHVVGEENGYGGSYPTAVDAINDEDDDEDLIAQVEAAESIREAFESGDFQRQDAKEAFDGEFPVYPSLREFDDVMTKVYAAITATTGVSMGSIGVLLDGTPPATLPYMAGWFLFEEDDDKPKVQNNALNFIIGQDDQYGFTKLYFDFSFKAFGSRSAFTWHINGGLDNYIIDDGKGMGGAILFRVGDPSAMAMAMEGGEEEDEDEDDEGE